ncbi:MAG: SDR family NAD(P)-dependent oxidoreductase, partial [Bradyrhizobium sp.]
MTTAILRGHTALVTGGSRGIGAAIVRTLAEAGAAIAINYHERGVETNALVKDIAAAGGRAIAVGADVSQADAVVQMV